MCKSKARFYHLKDSSIYEKWPLLPSENLTFPTKNRFPFHNESPTSPSWSATTTKPSLFTPKNSILNYWKIPAYRKANAGCWLPQKAQMGAHCYWRKPKMKNRRAESAIKPAEGSSYSCTLMTSGSITNTLSIMASISYASPRKKSTAPWPFLRICTAISGIWCKNKKAVTNQCNGVYQT